MNFKNTFLKLTEYTVPYGNEPMLEKYMPKKYTKDGVGNYVVKNGRSSKTVFTCHMDTASYRLQKVNHVIDGEYIKTDGSSILGGDDKNGMTILLYMIEQGVPGTYYFFAGEEAGMAGAKKIIGANKKFFDKFDRMISIDRRGYNSVITRQMGAQCCSNIFGTALADELNRNGMHYRLDPTGIYTDSASFIGIIPNVTNLSCGYFDEHSTMETTNIDFVEELGHALCGVNWENLPLEGPPKKTFGYGYGDFEDSSEFWW